MENMIKLLPSLPTDPVKGQGYYDPIKKRFYRYDGSEWALVTDDIAVRYKFRCIRKEPLSVDPKEGYVGLSFEAITRGSPENEEFFKWTPSGWLEFYTVNAAAAEQFEIGEEYYLDITRA
jgi:hypothetical protein